MSYGELIHAVQAFKNPNVGVWITEAEINEAIETWPINSYKAFNLPAYVPAGTQRIVLRVVAKAATIGRIVMRTGGVVDQNSDAFFYNQVADTSNAGQFTVYTNGLNYIELSRLHNTWTSVEIRILHWEL